jgi:hypothetical protein
MQQLHYSGCSICAGIRSQALCVYADRYCAHRLHPATTGAHEVVTLTYNYGITATRCIKVSTYTAAAAVVT